MIDQIRNIYENMMEEMQKIDSRGSGLLLVTNNENRMTDVVPTEMALFMMRIMALYLFPNQEQGEILDIVLNQGFAYKSSEELGWACMSADTVEAENNVSIVGAVLEDIAQTNAHGIRITSTTELLITVYKLMSKALIAAGGDNVGASEYADEYISKLEKRAKEQRETFDKIMSQSDEAGEEDAAETKRAPQRRTTKASGKKKSGSNEFTGIHHVTEQPKYVTYSGSWAVKVSPGYSYTMDPEILDNSPEGPLSLMIQSTDDCDFSKGMESGFNLCVMKGGALFEKIFDCYDLNSDEAISEMLDLVKPLNMKFYFARRTQDIAILQVEPDRKKDVSSATFVVFTRGNQEINFGKVVVRGRTPAKAKKEISASFDMFKYDAPSLNENYVPEIIPKDYGFSYTKHKTLKLENDVYIPIPDGMKASKDKSLIGERREFVMIPEKFDDYSNVFEAKAGFTCLRINPEDQKIPYSPGNAHLLFDQVFKFTVQQNYFSEEIPGVFTRMTTKGLIYMQGSYDLDTLKRSYVRAIMFVNHSCYFLTMIINFKSKIADRQDVAIEVQKIAKDWMNRIDLPGEELCKRPEKEKKEEDGKKTSSPASATVTKKESDTKTSASKPAARRQGDKADPASPSGTTLKADPTASEDRRAWEENRRRQEAEREAARAAEEENRRRQEAEAEAARKKQFRRGYIKEKRREEIRQKIDDLRREQEEARGLLAGIKRKKLQMEIDKLTKMLNEI